LEIATTNSNAILTLHNSISGRNYSISSKQSLSLTNWTLETNFLGAAAQDWTQVSIPMGQRSNLFFRASEVREYVVNTNSSFQGLTGQDTLGEPPDSMIAVGPDHIVELLNLKVAVFPKTKAPPLQVAVANDFFAVTDNGTNYPQGNMVDPRILYDPVAHRWIASMIDYGVSFNVILAVSKTNTPLDLVAGFSGSSPSNYVGAFFASRLAGCSVSTAPMLIQAGGGYYSSSDHWGDYSRTLVDPNDDRSFWTVQEYADPAAFEFPWATWIVRIKPNP